MHNRLRYIKRSRQGQRTQGFTLVEVLVAGVLLAAVMASVGRMSTSALASSAKQAERARIEAAINNNIQNLQMEDSYLRFTEMTPAEQEESCKNPISKLQSHLISKVPEPIADAISEPIERTFEALDEAGMDILVVNYKFKSPEYKGKADAEERWEYRRIELNPNFSSQCYTTIN
jgi:type II secretory pathway pseudopilin PulG